MRTLIIGDIHGKIDSLKGVLDLASYDPATDRVICVGDYIDGGKMSFEVVEYLLDLDQNSMQDNVFILGNHDKEFLDILTYDFERLRDWRHIEEMHWEWYANGGQPTYASYIKEDDQAIIRHRELFFKKLKYYHEENNNLYVHAGYDFTIDIKSNFESNPSELLWDRHLYKTSINDLSDGGEDLKFGPYDKIYIGHTPTVLYGDVTPRKRANVINVDQGCKIDGTLSAWVDETDTFFQYKQ